MMCLGCTILLQNIVDLNLQVVQRLLQKNYIVKSDAKIFLSEDCGHGWHFKSIYTALLAKYFENEEGKHLVGPTFAQLGAKIHAC